MARIGKPGALGPLDDNMEPDEEDEHEGAEVRRAAVPPASAAVTAA